MTTTPNELAAELGNLNRSPCTIGFGGRTVQRSPSAAPHHLSLDPIVAACRHFRNERS